MPERANESRRRLESAGWSVRAEFYPLPGGGAWVAYVSREGRSFSAAGATEAEALTTACRHAEAPGPPRPEAR